MVTSNITCLCGNIIIAHCLNCQSFIGRIKVLEDDKTDIENRIQTLEEDNKNLKNKLKELYDILKLKLNII